MPQSSKQIQTQNQQQIQTLSPLQLMVVKLLELPTIELEDRVRMEIQDNPALDTEDSSSIGETSTSTDDGDTDYNPEDDYRTEEDMPDYSERPNNGQGEQLTNIPISDSTSFFELLQSQLNECDLDEEHKEIGLYLLGSLDDDGILRKNLEDISTDLAIYQGIDCTPQELDSILKMIQSFDPAGIGARDLQECLLIQLKRKEQMHPQDTRIKLGIKIIEDLFDDFTKKHWEGIYKKLGCKPSEAQDALSEVKKLNPRPGASLGENIGKTHLQIIPDFILDVSEDGSQISINLNNYNIPQLYISRSFSDQIKEFEQNKVKLSKDQKDALTFTKQKIESAQNFINAIKQRHDTLLSTMQAIADIQHDFFVEGDELKIHPMILKDIAERTHLDISTISRVSNSKYVQTPYGIYPLKFFFADGYTTESGEEMSVREIKQILKEIIEQENKKKPYTDDELTEQLNAKGYPIARRTTSKYREQLRIPIARLRKE